MTANRPGRYPRQGADIFNLVILHCRHLRFTAWSSEMVSATVVFLVCFSLAQVSSFRSQMYGQHISHWCSYFKRNRVYTLNNWMKCPKYIRPLEEHDLVITREFRVAVLQKMSEFRHDCWAVATEERLLLQESYGTFLLGILQDILKFKLRAVPADTINPGLSANSTRWDEMQDLVGLVARGDADLAICHLTVTPSRVGMVDFLHSTLTTRRALVFVPSRLSIDQDVFVITFSATLWMCFLIGIVLLIATFRFSTWIHSIVRPEHESWSWVEVMLWAVAATCQQSYTRHPKGLSCRTTFIIGYLITYLLYTGFAAGITSKLAVQGRGMKLSLKDVVERKLSLVATSHTTHHPLVTGPDKYTKFERYNRAKEVKNNEELFQKLEEDNTVGFGVDIHLENHLWRKVPQSLQEEYTISVLQDTRTQESLIVKKKSPYKEVFNYWLLRMQEIGLLTLGRSRYIDVPQESCCDAPGWSSAGIGNVLSAILILMGGYLFSTLILLCEMAWMRKHTGTMWEARTKQDVLLQYNRYQKLLHSSK